MWQKNVKIEKKQLNNVQQKMNELDSKTHLNKKYH